MVKIIRGLAALGFTGLLVGYFIAGCNAFRRDDFARATFYMAVSIRFELSAMRLSKAGEA